MIQKHLTFYLRRFLDEPPTESLACAVYAVEEDSAVIRCSDGSQSCTFDFFLETEAEQEVALKKLEKIEDAIHGFGVALREQIAKKRAAVDAIASSLAFLSGAFGLT
jgi:hypothetical protein